MSYRSLKRIVGETSLERKCRFLFGACLFLLISGSFLAYSRQTELLVERQNRSTGKFLAKSFVTNRHWSVYQQKDESAPGGDDFGLSVKALQDEMRGNDYVATFLRHNITENEFTSKPVDDKEWDVLTDKFPIHRPDFVATDELGEPEAFSAVSPDGSKYQYFQPVRASSERCVICHTLVRPPYWTEQMTEAEASVAGAKLQIGDALGLVKLEFPRAQAERDLQRNRATLASLAVVTVFLAMIASWAIVKYVIVKPLNHLRDVSDAISRGNMEMRADIQTADEFEELGIAFNRMLRHLMAVQQELREVNADLDGKVDQLAQANMRLFEANRLKGDFLATMSHELRTPLNSIIGFSDVLASIRTLDEKQRRYVLNIQKSGKVLLEMINEVLDLAKIESGKMNVRPASFRIEHVLHAQCDMARPLTEKKNIDLDLHIQPELPELYQDQAKIQQIFNNLLSNAIKFTPEGGRITASAAQEGNELVMMVADTGVGIAPEDQATVFEKFRQGSSASPTGDAMTREHSGTGLGLSIVKELCRLLGGEVELESELGKGSTFTVRVPYQLNDVSNLQGTLIEAANDLARATTRLEQEHPAATLAAGANL
ncbi:MAG: ATP-binding protein [Planctomycetia bacterium]|nr:ATP-binding protein [Planctomycetia bacterium]